MYKIPSETTFIGKKLFHLPHCTSTSSYLIDLIKRNSVSEGAIVITDNQTNGRGQHGSKWESEPEQNLTFSILLNPIFLPIQEQFNLSMTISIAIATALRPFLPCPIKLKWPNDIYANNKKLGGVLIENQVQYDTYKVAVVGIGINVNQYHFTNSKAVSILNFRGIQHNLNSIFQRIIIAIENEYLNLKNGKKSQIKLQYLKSLYKLNTVSRFKTQSGDFFGKIVNVDEDGKLSVEIEGIIKKFLFKEISFLE